MVMGILIVENLHLSDMEKYCIYPVAYLTGSALIIWGFFNYISDFPPEAQIWDAPYDTCCYQLLACGGADEFKGERYEIFGCTREYDEEDENSFVEIVTTGIDDEEGHLDTCDEMRVFYEAYNFTGG